MSGRKSRDRGNNHERHMARLLSDIVPEGQVVSTRNSRGGRQLGADLCWRLGDGSERPDVLGWSVECKTTQGLFPTVAMWDKWFEQALADSGVFEPVVLYRQHGRSDCWAALSRRDDVCLVPLEAWLRQVGREGER